MYIPRLGFTWNKPVLEDTEVSTLKKGLGHYANTARLGQQGNFSVAGHRRTYGDPFKDFPRLRRGDAWPLIAPAAFVSLALPLVVFLGFQRYFVQGMLAGSVK